jgi:competence protein ComEC
MIRWIPYTFVRTVLFFIGGVAMGMYAPDLLPQPWDTVVVCGGVVLYIILVLFKGKILFNPGWLGLPLVFVMGYVHLLQNTESRHAGHFMKISRSIDAYRAVVTGFAEEKAHSWKVQARVAQVHTTRWETVEGRVLLYFSKEAYKEPFGYGDVLLISGHPQIPDGPANPGEFDYRAHLALQNVYHEHFVRKAEAVKMGYDPPSRLMAVAYHARNWSQATLNRYVAGPREQAIAAALVLGVTDGLDNELLDAYAATGSMHILAVSGLHISILYFILLSILSPLKKLAGGKWVVPVVGLLVMWMYTFITGLPPSVLRAVTMFSFLALARIWARNSNVFNTLAVSAFCLLLYDPFLIRSVGFQLSYLAVLGIVYLYPRVLVLWEPTSRVMTEIWKITTVSLAAQCATFALGLLYFHQFPNVFLLSNLLVVPLSSFVLIGGISVLGVSFIPALASVLGTCVEMLIRFLNYIVFSLESIPFGLTQNVYINVWQCALLMVFLIASLALVHYRKFGYMVAAVCVILCYTALQWWHFSRDVNVSTIAVYSIPGHGAVDLIDRGQTFFITDSALLNDSRAIRYHITPNRLIRGVGTVRSEIPASKPLKGCRLMTWHGRTILHITDRNFEVPRLNVDLVIIGNNAVPDVASIMSRITFRKAVLDSSNSFTFATRFLRSAKSRQIDVYSVLHKGAFISLIENHDS